MLTVTLGWKGRGRAAPAARWDSRISVIPPTVGLLFDALWQALGKDSHTQGEKEISRQQSRSH